MTVVSLALHISVNMDTFESVRPSIFADITIIAVERSWLFKFVQFDVAEELKST